MSADTTPGLDYEREQDAFELAFPMPANCLRFPGGYAPTEFNAWDASKFCERWEGWKAARRAPAPAQGPTDAEIEALAEQHLWAAAQFTGAGKVWCEGEVAFARAVLARWGAPAASGERLARKTDKEES